MNWPLELSSPLSTESFPAFSLPHVASCQIGSEIFETGRQKTGLPQIPTSNAELHALCLSLILGHMQGNAVGLGNKYKAHKLQSFVIPTVAPHIWKREASKGMLSVRGWECGSVGRMIA